MWADYKITSTEDQQKFIVPINRITERLYYNQRMLIDAPVQSEPRAWHISKINRIAANGLVSATLAQVNFNQYTDYIEIDESGKTIGLWADYFSLPVEPADPETAIQSCIAYSGLKPELKIRGGYKKFTVAFSTDNGDAEFQDGQWSYQIDNADASNLVSVLTAVDSSDLEQNQIKVKFIGNEEYLNKKLKIIYTTNSGTVSQLDVSIIAL